ncbi:L1Tc protein [Trypanosoma cruzi]|nr:L1Tc protein [Trypanosoma cruzi]
MLRGVPQRSVLGPYLFSLYVHPLLNLLNSFAGVTADMYADDLSIIVKGQSREDAIPTANMVLKKLHAWSQENGLAINPSKCEAACFTLSTHTESDYDREGKWPPEVAGCKIPVMTMGAAQTTKLLGMDPDPRLTANVAATKQCAATSQRISQLRRIAHKEAGPSPHDLRTFVIGYGAPKLRYGSELIWAVAADSAKNEMQETYSTLARIVSGVPSTVDPESALLEANMPPLHVLCLRARLSIFENTRTGQMDWMRRRLSRATASRRFPHLAVISGRAICLCRRVHKGLWHHPELTTRRAVLSQLHSSLVCGLRSLGHHWRGTFETLLNNRRNRACNGEAPSQRRGSSDAQPLFAVTRNRWRR